MAYQKLESFSKIIRLTLISGSVASFSEFPELKDPTCFGSFFNSMMNVRYSDYSFAVIHAVSFNELQSSALRLISVMAQQTQQCLL